MAAVRSKEKEGEKRSRRRRTPDVIQVGRNIPALRRLRRR